MYKKIKWQKASKVAFFGILFSLFILATLIMSGAFLVELKNPAVAIFNSGDSTVSVGDLVYLFDQSDLRGASGTALSFMQRQWRVVARSGSTLTLYMHGPYRNAVFNPSGVNTWEDSYLNYNSPVSILRQDLEAVLDIFPEYRDAFVATNIAQEDITYNSTNPAVVNSKIWLPSTYEVHDTGIWGLDVATRAAPDNGFNGWSALRSSVAGYTNAVSGVHSGGFWSYGAIHADSSIGVRPAVNINASFLGSDSFDAGIETEGSLFNIDGTINGSVLGVFSEIEDLHGRTFRLLEGHGTGVTASFTARDWRVVEANEDYLTLFMHGAYRNAAFSPQDSNVWANSHLNYVHANSILRTDLNNSLAPFPADLRNTFLVTNIAEQPTMGESTNPAVVNSRIWLPSFREAREGWGLFDESLETAGGLGQAPNNGYFGWSWLRSGRTTHTDQVGGINHNIGLLIHAAHAARLEISVRPVVRISADSVSEFALSSTDASLATLTLANAANDSAISFSPAFTAGATSGTFSTTTLPYATDSISLTATPTISDGTSVTATLNGEVVDDLTQSLSLENYGTANPNVLHITVTARDGETTAEFTINIVRGNPNTNFNLASLSVTGTGLGAMSPVFAQGTINYTISAEEDSTEAEFCFTKAVDTSTVTVNITNRILTDESVSVNENDGDFTGSVFLTAGNNILRFVVVAQNGASRTYTVTIVVAEDDDEVVATLFALDIFNHDTSEQIEFGFDSDVFEYTIEVCRFLTELTLRVEAFASGQGSITGVLLNGVEIDITSPLHLVDLEVANTLEITVESYNGENTEVYTIEIIRELPPEEPTVLDTPDGISVSSSGRLSWNAVSNAVGYNIEINGVNHIHSSVVAEFDIVGYRVGTFNIRIQAIGCGEWYTYSVFSEIYPHEHRVRLDTPGNLRIENGRLVWDAVADAYSYEVRVSGIAEVFSTNIASFDLSILAPGSRTITVRAIAEAEDYFDNSLDSTAFPHTITRQLGAAEIVAEITVNRDGNRIFWNRISDAIGYYLYIDGVRQTVNITGRQVVLDLADGVYSIQIRARGDGVVFLEGELSNTVTITIEQGVIVCAGCGQEPCICLVVEFCEICDEYPCVCEDDPVEVDKSALAALVLEVGLHLEQHGEGYSQASVDRVKAALEAASLVLANSDASQAEIDAAYLELRAAFEGLIEEGGVFTWPGFPAIFMLWHYPNNFWPWFFWGLGLLLILLIIIIAIVVTKKKRARLDDDNGELDACRSKARDAINAAFSELRQAGELVTACELDTSLEQQAMVQLSKTDAAMSHAESCVAEFLKAKKLDKKKAK